ncbi:Replication factor-A protein 1-related protein [Prunus dulcis]|uniref:Replication protein A subunit n=1 Tax=Prunus dulcis TaxID=3755 RepID=A0A4Y1REX6_PRUDU|nr:Replication factor-A protein 1-related protein [Prunus dulcis]
MQIKDQIHTTRVHIYSVYVAYLAKVGDISVAYPVSTMAVKLTEGAIMKICTGEYHDETWKPILQVLDVRMVNTARSGAQPGPITRDTGFDLGWFPPPAGDAGHPEEHTGSARPASEGLHRLLEAIHLYPSPKPPSWLSIDDGSKKENLIIIIIELDLVLDKCDLIGEPVAGPKYLNAQSSGALPGNAQSIGGSAHSGGAVHQTVTKATPEQPRVNQSFGSAYSGGSDPGRHATMSTTPNHPKPETGFGFPGSAPLSGSYSNQNTGFRSPRPEVPQPTLNAYARPPQPTYQQPSPTYPNRGPVAKNEAPPRIMPIAALNPYQGRWTIKARVTAKGELRHYSNPRGDGKVFSFDVLDSHGGEIRATCFNAVADQFYNQIEVGKIYLISKGSLKAAQKAFNNLNNDHEITLDHASIIQPCFEDDDSIPKQNFHFCRISDVEGLNNNSIVDVIGVVSSINPPASILRKNGVETQKRSLQLKDMSGRSVEVTLWGNLCNAEGQRLQSMCDSGAFPVLAVKGAKVNDFNGKAVGTIPSSQLFIEPNIEEAREMRSWFDKEGRNTSCIPISRETAGVGRTDIRKSISQIKDERLGLPRSQTGSQLVELFPL